MNQEDSVECSDNQKEENGQDSTDKCKMERKTEAHDEKEIFNKKEIKEVFISVLDFNWIRILSMAQNLIDRTI